MLRLAVIGLGNISFRHRKNLKLLYPESKVIALSARGKVLTELPDSADLIVSEVAELIRLKPYFVIVASPASMHLQHAKELIQAGIPCLIEKPLCINFREAESLLKVSQEELTPTAVGYCLRYMPAAKKMQELINNNILGEIYNITIEVGQYLPDWRQTIDYRDSVSAQQELGGGALLELSHEFDYAQWLFGPLCVEHAVLRSSKELGLDVEDLVDVVFSTESGAQAHVHLDFLQHQPQRFCTVKGENGRIHWDLLKSTVDIFLNHHEHQHFAFNDWQVNDMYLDLIKDFENLCLGKKHFTVDLAQAAETLNLIDMIKKST
ncbi:Oxidoreductase P35 [Pseudoalteromonas haloplanktis]|uniref:Oxidoreductase P35 n=1 Tax=Pseudoalteromonas haloplanktis TaxID=228 RepID=A0A9W4QSK6_PSEHA|nr:Gfo/Idh/MocA family oxidoreductase [Pseudoalteromonas haloplanktis]CAH9051422.1 Oxidoreductase P35 [Pseudoalteromonas haloplanktis]